MHSITSITGRGLAENSNLTCPSTFNLKMSGKLYNVKKEILILLFQLLLFPFISYSQYLKNYVAPSPTAASLGKYGDIPVNYYTGVPSISVPLFSIGLNDFTYSCSLSYNAEGLRAMEESSNVGLNWAINNTGVITRSVKLLDDFSSNGYFRTPPSNRTIGSGKDLEPDIFNYNFNGKFGKFLIDYPDDNTPYKIRFLTNPDDMKIEIIDNDNWKITDREGTVYKFEKKENQSQQTTSNGKADPTFSYISAWYLTSITTFNDELITFNYKGSSPKIIRDYAGSISNTIVSVSPQPPCAYLPGGPVYEFQLSNRGTNSNTHTLTDEIILDEITYKGGKVSFFYADRIDLLTDAAAASQLNEIKMYNSDNQQIKHYSFIYSYFTSPGNIPSYLSKRLKLDGLMIDDMQNEYRFDYNESDNFPQKTITSGAGYYTYGPLIEIGMLDRIFYPTGGYTEFEYERQISRLTTHIFLGGGSGIRIKRIINKSNTDVPEVQRFDYTKVINGDTVSSGVDLPQSMSSFPNATVAYCDNLPVLITYQTNYINNVLSSDYNNIVGYDEVTVYHGENGENGKSTYMFKNDEDYYPSLFPGAYGARNPENGTLLTEEVYRKNPTNDYFLLSKKDYSYESLDDHTVTGAKIVSGQLSYYNVFTKRFRMTSEKDSSYTENGNVFSKTINYLYDGSPYLQSSAIETNSSSGVVNKVIKRHAYDMVSLGQTVPYQQMVNKNMIDQIVEEEEQMNNQIVSKKITSFTAGWPNNGNLIMPSSIKTQHNNEVPEVRAQYLAYDNIGNPLTTSTAGVKLVSYKWGYNKQYIVAECTNAGENEFLLEDFEGNGVLNANSLNAHTGTGAFSGTINLANYFSPTLNSRSFELSYFLFNGTSWVFQQTKYLGQSLSGLIDDIRIYPSNSQITTYTYKPIIGMASSISPSGQTTYYEYDNLNRLETISDQHRNILKSFDYHYKP